MRFVRIVMLAAAIAGFVWFGFFNTASAGEVARLALDSLDPRPARSILFIGNSRTYPHDMPYMVRRIADSANAPEKYQIRMHALPGETLEGHWRNPHLRRLLAEGWSDVVIQAHSGAHRTDADSDSFRRYGAELVREAAAQGARPTLFVGWNYGGSVFEGAPPGTAQGHYRRIQADHRRLAAATDARLANVGRVWRAVVEADPPFRLDTDGNHPSLHGSYVTALIFYAHFSGRDVSDVTYAPAGLSEDEAALARRLVGDSLHLAE